VPLTFRNRTTLGLYTAVYSGLAFRRRQVEAAEYELRLYVDEDDADRDRLAARTS